MFDLISKRRQKYKEMDIGGRTHSSAFALSCRTPLPAKRGE
jgi:hypothetical protein